VEEVGHTSAGVSATTSDVNIELVITAVAAVAIAIEVTRPLLVELGSRIAARHGDDKCGERLLSGMRGPEAGRQAGWQASEFAGEVWEGRGSNGRSWEEEEEDEEGESRLCPLLMRTGNWRRALVGFISLVGHDPRRGFLEHGR
jgi:hypothetical protein